MKFLDDQILDNSHIYSLRIHYEDTDIGGIVYHTKYLNFIERARSSLIRLLGFPAEKFLKLNPLNFINIDQKRTSSKLHFNSIWRFD